MRLVLFFIILILSNPGSANELFSLEDFAEKYFFENKDIDDSVLEFSDKVDRFYTWNLKNEPEVSLIHTYLPSVEELIPRLVGFGLKNYRVVELKSGEKLRFNYNKIVEDDDIYRQKSLFLSVIDVARAKVMDLALEQIGMVARGELDPKVGKDTETAVRYVRGCYNSANVTQVNVWDEDYDKEGGYDSCKSSWSKAFKMMQDPPSGQRKLIMFIGEGVFRHAEILNRIAIFYGKNPRLRHIPMLEIYLQSVYESNSELDGIGTSWFDPVKAEFSLSKNSKYYHPTISMQDFFYAPNYMFDIGEMVLLHEFCHIINGDLSEIELDEISDLRAEGNADVISIIEIGNEIKADECALKLYSRKRSGVEIGIEPPAVLKPHVALGLYLGLGVQPGWTIKQTLTHPGVLERVSNLRRITEKFESAYSGKNLWSKYSIIFNDEDYFSEYLSFLKKIR